MPKANGEGSISLRIFDIIIDIPVKQIEHREEEFLFAGLMQWGFMINIKYVDINGLAIEQSLQYLYLIIISLQLVILLLLCFDFNEAVENGRSPKLIHAIYFYSILQQLFKYLWRGIKICSIGHQMM